MTTKSSLIIYISLIVILTTLGLLISIKIGLVIFASFILLSAVFINPFIGLILYLSIIYLRPQEFIPGLKGQPLALMLAVVVLATYIIHNSFQKKEFLFTRFRQGFFMIIFFIIILLSQLQHFYLTGFKNAFDRFIPTFMLFVMITNLISNMKQLKKVIFLLIFLTTLICIDGIYQYYNGIDIAGQTMVSGRIRWIGIFEDPNDLGIAILSFTPFPLLYLLKKGTKFLNKVFWFIILAIYLYALYLTNSRGTFLGLMALLAYYSIKRWGWAKGIIGSVPIIILIFAVGPSRMSELSLNEASASGRIEAWSTGLKLLIWRPILGVGFGNFTMYHPLTAHNSIVLCWSELGLIGLFVWLFIITSSFEEMILIEQKAINNELTLLASGLQLSIISFFISAFFLSKTYDSVLVIIIALCTLLSYFSRIQLGYKIKFIKFKEIIFVLIFLFFLIITIKILVMIG